MEQVKVSEKLYLPNLGALLQSSSALADTVNKALIVRHPRNCLVQVAEQQQEAVTVSTLCSSSSTHYLHSFVKFVAAENCYHIGYRLHDFRQI